MEPNSQIILWTIIWTIIIISIVIFMMRGISFLFSIAKEEEKKNIENQRESDWLQDIFTLAIDKKNVEYIFLCGTLTNSKSTPMDTYKDSYFRIIMPNTDGECGDVIRSQGKDWDIALIEAFEKQGLKIKRVATSSEDDFYSLRLHF
jgi:hypothetical protein